MILLNGRKKKEARGRFRRKRCIWCWVSDVCSFKNKTKPNLPAVSCQWQIHMLFVNWHTIANWKYSNWKLCPSRWPLESILHTLYMIAMVIYLLVLLLGRANQKQGWCGQAREHFCILPSWQLPGREEKLFRFLGSWYSQTICSSWCFRNQGPFQLLGISLDHSNFNIK